MAEWPKWLADLSRVNFVDRQPDPVTWHEVIPADLGRELYEALDGFRTACLRVADRNPGHPDEAAVRELAEMAHHAVARYEREVNGG